MAKAKKADKKGLIVRAQSGTDLRAWRQAVGLRLAEVAELIGVSERSVSRAESSAEPSRYVLVGMQLLQERLLAGQLDIRPLIQRRVPQGRPKKTGQTPQKKPRKDRTTK